MKPFSLANSNKEKFIETFNELYEHSPWIIEKAFETVKSDRKYDDLKEFHNLLSQIVLEANKELQNLLIKAHPMLAGKKAMANELTDFSTNEQKSAGLNSCSEEEIKKFDELNQKYFKKFGFPFIMAVKGSTKNEILRTFLKRVQNSLFEEKIEALKQINKIGWIRIKDIYEK
jgi:OHCU decarboxylase